MVEVALLDVYYERGNDRGCYSREIHQIFVLIATAEQANSALAQLASNSYLADIALQSGLDICTTISERQSNQVTPATTPKLTVSAVIGAVWLDSNKSINSVKGVMQNLKYGLIHKSLFCSAKQALGFY